MEWISVNDRLPEIIGSYLVVLRDGTVTCAVRCLMLYEPIWNLNLLGGFSILPENEVTHWMPLPEPPKGENKNG